MWSSKMIALMLKPPHAERIGRSGLVTGCIISHHHFVALLQPIDHLRVDAVIDANLDLDGFYALDFSVYSLYRNINRPLRMAGFCLFSFFGFRLFVLSGFAVAAFSMRCPVCAGAVRSGRFRPET